LQWFGADGTDKVALVQTFIMTTWHTVSLFLHLVAFAMWIGAMVFFLVVMGPAVHDMEPSIAIRTMDRGRIGLETISWIGIGLLFVTGIANLALRDPVAAAPGSAYMILLGGKLFVFLAMTVHHCLQVFKYAPSIARQTAAISPSATVWPEPLLSDWRRWFMLLKLNAGLGPVAVLLGLALAQG
jgi:putative copper export protein